MDKKSIFSLCIEACIFIIIISFMHSHFSRENETLNQNLIAYKNDLEEVELKNGELITSRDSYILQINELEEQFNLSKKEVKDLKKQLGASLAYISILESNVNVDTVVTVKDSIIYIDKNEVEVRFHYSDDWFGFNGLTKMKDGDASTSIYNMNMRVPLEIGLMENYKLYVKTDNPYVELSNIEGAVIDKSILYPKQKRWSWGLQGGFGFLYDVTRKDIGMGLYVGIGGQYKIN